MADPYRTVDGIRAYLLSGDTAFKEPLRALADDYAQICEEANERLARCARLLGQGLRSEAIHLAEAPPHLLDLMAALDFVELPAWVEAVERYNLAVLPALDVKSAEHLDTAYAEQNPLENLLKRHRRLALVRGPLAERVHVLRELARLDSANAFWPKDLLAYEQARLKQVPAEANDAVRRLDAKALLAIDEELHSPRWTAKPSTMLVQSVREALEGIRRAAALRELETLEGPLHNARAAQDLARARPIRDRWLAAAKLAQLAPKHPLLERVGPDLDWIEREDRYQTALDALRQGLEARVKRPKLERLHDNLLGCEREVPADLEKAYQDRIAELKLAERRRQRLAKVIGVAALMVLGVIAIVMYREQARSSRTLAVAGSLRQAIGSGLVDHVEGLVAGLERDEPALLKSAEVIAVWPGVERLRAEEAERAGRFASRIAEVDGSPPSAAEPASVAEAGKLARTANDRARLEAARGRWAKRTLAEIDRRDRELLPELRLLEGELLAMLDVPAEAASPAAPAALERVVADWQRLMPTSGPLSAAVREQSSNIERRIHDLRGLADARNRRLSAAVRLTQVVERQPIDPAEYASALAELARAHENTSYQTNVGRLLDGAERSVWEGALGWSNLARPWSGLREPLSPETARQRLGQIVRLRDRTPRLPDWPRIDDYRGYLQAIARRDEPSGGLVSRMNARLLSDLIIDPLWMIKYQSTDAAGSRKYYSVTSPPAKRSYQLGYLIDYNGRESPKKTSIAANLVQYNDWSPQTQIARSLKRELQQATSLARWDAVMIAAASKITTDPEMDPLCKLLFVNGLVEETEEGSTNLKAALAPRREALLQLKRRFETICWMNPDVNASASRAEATRFLDRIPWDEIGKSCQQADEARRQWLIDQPWAVGWIDHETDGWTCRLAATAAASEGELVVAARDGEQTGWRSVGRLGGSPRKATLTDQALLAPGKLLFLRRRAGSNVERLP